MYSLHWEYYGLKAKGQISFYRSNYLTNPMLRLAYDVNEAQINTITIIILQHVETNEA